MKEGVGKEKAVKGVLGGFKWDLMGGLSPPPSREGRKEGEKVEREKETMQLRKILISHFVPIS